MYCDRVVLREMEVLRWLLTDEVRDYWHKKYVAKHLYKQPSMHIKSANNTNHILPNIFQIVDGYSNSQFGERSTEHVQITHQAPEGSCQTQSHRENIVTSKVLCNIHVLASASSGACSSLFLSLLTQFIIVSSNPKWSAINMKQFFYSSVDKRKRLCQCIARLAYISVWIHQLAIQTFSLDQTHGIDSRPKGFR